MHKILETSMLECETIDEKVQFDDEWGIFKNLTGRKRQRISSHVSSIFPSSPSQAKSNTSSARNSLIVDTRGDGATNPEFSTRTTPLDMINILSGALLVMELYEINPALIIQVFSQLFCWMAAEVFNGMMLGGKKYLCRSKAMQIKMNLEIVAEWVKSSSLPSSLYNRHFERVLQLLQVSPFSSKRWCRQSIADHSASTVATMFLSVDRL